MTGEGSSSPRSIPALRVLHVGIANRGLWPLEQCNEGSGFEPAALCDPHHEALREARKRTGLAEECCFERFEAALIAARGRIDCAIICTPTRFHGPYAIACLEAGVPVLVEKGMAPDWPSARELAGACERTGGKACVSQNYRYNRVERTIRAALVDSTHPAHVGRVHIVVYSQHRVRPEPRTLSYPFASVWDMSCHHFDNLAFWFGPISEMVAQSFRAEWSAYEHDNNTSAHLVFASGVRAQYLHTHDAARASLEIQIHGERGPSE